MPVSTPTSTRLSSRAPVSHLNEPATDTPLPVTAPAVNRFSSLTPVSRPNEPVFNTPPADDAPAALRLSSRPPVSRPNDRFTPSELAGSGPTDEVWIAQDHEVGHPVALKVIRSSLAKNDRAVGAFLREGYLTARLTHPGILPVYGFATTAEGRQSYATKLVRDPTLTAFLQTAREAPTEVHGLSRRLELFLKLCDTLAYAHEHGIIHCNLKPDDILVGDHGEVSVLNWGMAHESDTNAWRKAETSLAQERPEARTPDRMTAQVGTPHYMSPEQARCEPDLDPRSDEYTLGLILFEMVALSPAVSSSDLGAVLANQMVGRREPFVHALGEPIPPELVAIVDRACAPNRKDRYDEIRALAADIRRYLGGEAVLARRDTWWQATRRWVANHQGPTIGAGGFLTGLVAVGGLVTWNAWIARERANDLELQRLANVQGRVAAHAARLDTEFANLEGMLDGIATATVDRLRDATPHEGGPIYWADQETLPPSTAAGERYDHPVSFDHAVFFSPPSFDRASHAGQAAALAPLRHTFRRSLLASSSDEAVGLSEAEAEKLLVDQGASIAWASIRLNSGLTLTYPGHTDLPTHQDASKGPWFQLPASQRDVVWGTPYLDPTADAVLLPASVALVGEGGTFHGVASIQIPLESMLSGMLRGADLPESTSVALVDEQGRSVISSTPNEPIAVSKALSHGEEHVPYPVAEVVASARAGKSGAVRKGGDLILFSHMPALGWTYVIRGKASKLL